jgi:copper oxidase (laccase) domain-containing protein
MNDKDGRQVGALHAGWERQVAVDRQVVPRREGKWFHRHQRVVSELRAVMPPASRSDIRDATYDEVHSASDF